MNDRSLDEFLGASSETTDATDAADVEPATPTYRWDADGSDCTACGSTVVRGWFDGGRFVCADCKEW